jgi:hypothetical protein
MPIPEEIGVRSHLLTLPVPLCGKTDDRIRNSKIAKLVCWSRTLVPWQDVAIDSPQSADIMKNNNHFRKNVLDIG